VSAGSVLDICGFDLKRTLALVPEFLQGCCNHPHDDSVLSFSFTVPGNVDLSSLKLWVDRLLQSKGENIYRMRGVIAVARSEQKFVCQGVHQLFNGDFDEKWGKDEVRESKLLFIGKKLDKEALKAGLKACVVTPDFDEIKRKSLRFAIGEKVRCNTDSGWKKGRVVDHMYRDEYMEPGLVAPYQVKLADGDLIYAPIDCDEVIRRVH
jgi:hypothetical protein